MQIILASQSPRRQELLKRVVPAFTIAPADIDETVGKDGLPAEYVAQMAAQKAAAIAEQSPEALVIGCDTIVALAGEILGKPTSREDGYRMLRLLSGKTHDVYTSNRWRLLRHYGFTNCQSSPTTKRIQLIKDSPFHSSKRERTVFYYANY